MVETLSLDYISLFHKLFLQTNLQGSKEQQYIVHITRQWYIRIFFFSCHNLSLYSTITYFTALYSVFGLQTEFYQHRGRNVKLRIDW